MPPPREASRGLGFLLYALTLTGGLIFGWVLRGAKEKPPPQHPS